MNEIYLATSGKATNVSGAFFDDKVKIVPIHERFSPAIGKKCGRSLDSFKYDRI